MSDRKLTVRDVAARFQRHEVTIRIALNDGSLHGSQRRPGTSWRIDDACAESWNAGEKCPHYSPKVNLMRRGA